MRWIPLTLLFLLASGVAFLVCGKPDRPARSESMEERGIQAPLNHYHGRVLDADGAPLEGAEVLLNTDCFTGLWSGPGPRRRAWEVRSRTDQHGRFAFADLEARDCYSLRVRHAEHALLESTTIPIGPVGIFEEPPLRMRRGAALRGHVRDAEGEPIAEAVLVLDSLPIELPGSPPPDRLETVSDKDGIYTFRHVDLGVRFLRIGAPGFATREFGDLRFDREQEVTRDVDLVIGALLCGRVVAEDKSGVAGATVMAIGFRDPRLTPRAEARSGARGEFCIEGLMPGEYTLIATCKGWRGRGSQRRATGTQDVQIDLERETQACGRVLDAASGLPVPNFRVRARWVDSRSPYTFPVEESVADIEGAADGGFCTGGLQGSDAGRYVVEVLAPGYASGFSAAFDVSSGRSVEGLEVRIGHGGGLRGRVVDGAGAPVPGALVATWDAEWCRTFGIGHELEIGTRATATLQRTDAQGSFAIANLNPETYWVTIEAADFLRNELREVGVAQGLETDLADVVLRRGGDVRGFVIDPDGKPVGGGVVWIEALDGQEPKRQRARVDSEGAFALRTLAAGRYRVSAWARDAAQADGIGFESSPLGGDSARVVTIEEGRAIQDLLVQVEDVR